MSDSGPTSNLILIISYYNLSSMKILHALANIISCQTLAFVSIHYEEYTELFKFFLEPRIGLKELSKTFFISKSLNIDLKKVQWSLFDQFLKKDERISTR